MNEWLKQVIEAINLLLQEGAALSVMLGLIIAIAGTQYLKKLDQVPSRKWIIRAIALPLGFISTFFTWPVRGITAVRIFVALAVGLAAPIVYRSFVSLVAVKWPDFAKRMSAEPDEETAPPVQEP